MRIAGLRITTKDCVIALALLGAGGWGAWIALQASGGIGARWTDGARTYAELDDVRYAVWDDPEPLGGGVASSEREGRAALSPDGRFLVFEVGERGLGADLYVRQVDAEGRDAVRPLEDVNSAYDDLAPAFGPGGLYFASDRSGTGFGLDLWRAPYLGDGAFGEPVPIAGGVNTAADETDPLPVPGTDALIFSSNRERGLRDDYALYQATPADPASFATDGDAWSVAALTVLDSPFDEREPGITTDGRVLVFASNRDGARGGFDLYRSLWAGPEKGGWLPPTPLDGVNSADDERAPLVSRDGFSLTFSRAAAPTADASIDTDGGADGDAAASGDADLFEARSRELFRLPPRPVTWMDVLVLLMLLLLALLALLGKRWRTMEILYKCFLVSLIIHLLLLWYLRHVHPESEPSSLGGEEDRLFRVRVERAGDIASGADRERGGALDAERSLIEPEQAPGREQTQAELASAAPAARALDRAEHEEALPGRSGAEPVPSAPAEATLVRLADADAPFERKQGDAPALALSAGPTAAAPAPSEGAAPARGETEAGPSAPESARNQALARGERPADALPRPSEVAAAPARRSLDGGEQVAVSQPAESFERRTGDVAGLALPAVASLAAPARDAEGPERANDANATAVSSDAGTDPLPRTAGPIASAEPPTPVDGDVPPRLGAPGLEPSRARTAPALALQDLPTEELRPQAGRAEEPPRFDATRAVAANFAKPAPREPDRAPAVPRPVRLTADRVPTPDDAPARRSFDVAQAPEPKPEATPSRLEHTPYRNRFGADKAEALELYGGSEETEAAVAAGLAYLASIQTEDGYWGSPRDRQDKYRQVLVGKTGLCLLAFLGAGHTPDSETEYADVARRAVDLLLSIQDERTGQFGDTSSYSHGIATYALAECFALTGDARLRRPLEHAVARIVSQQQHTSDPRTDGGWGYYYPDGSTWNRDRWPRVSVTAWQIMALESARLGGLTVADAVFDDARTFLASSWDDRLGAFRYSHDPGRLNSGWPTLPASTPAAVFALSLLGVPADDPALAEARDYVLERAPRRYARGSDEAFVRDAQGNLYFWYYATLATFRAGGNDWKRWNTALQETLLGGQQSDGSWRPISVYAEYAGDDDRDRSYTTAMCVLSLEVYYRYFTPLLEVR